MQAVLTGSNHSWDRKPRCQVVWGIEQDLRHETDQVQLRNHLWEKKRFKDVGVEPGVGSRTWIWEQIQNKKGRGGARIPQQDGSGVLYTRKNQKQVSE